MKYFLFLIVLFTFELYGKTKTIIINFNKPIKLNYLFFYYSTYENDEFETSFAKTGRKQVTFTTDSNFFKLYYSRSIEYSFENLQNSKSDTITIDPVKLVRHQFSDSSFIAKTRYKRDSTVRSKTAKTEIKKPENSDLFTPHEIRMNKTYVKGLKIIEPSGGNAWYCTPYKLAIYHVWKGKWITFIYRL